MGQRHMEVQAYEDTWHEYEINGETFVTYYEEDIPEDAERGEVYPNKWFSRLSAPGFTDCTSWEGPYYTEEGAMYGLYLVHGDSEETYFDFLEEGKQIEIGSLEIKGLRNELYGRAVGQEMAHLATLGDIDRTENGTKIAYDPNSDPDLAEAYVFELAKGRYLTELRQRVLNGERDSDLFLVVSVSRLFSDGSRSSTTVNLPWEWTPEERSQRAKEIVRLKLEENRRDQPRLDLELPTYQLIVTGESDNFDEWSDAEKEQDLE